MGLFTKKKKEDGYVNTMPKLPTLPELPGHSEFPEIPSPKQTPGELLNIKNEDEDKNIHKLPSFPSDELGEKISQETIKDAVGLPEEGYEYDDKEYEDEKLPPMIPGKVKEPTIGTAPYIENSPVSIKEKIEKEKEVIPRAKSVEPVFIRIDKFEESLKIFEGARRKISEIEELLKDTKEIKKREQEELTQWEEEILQLKNQIEKVDEDIFSKIK